MDLLTGAPYAAAFIAAVTLYAWRVVAPLRATRARLAAAAPACLACLVAPPLIFSAAGDGVLGLLLMGFMSSWLGLFRLVALALGRGAAARATTAAQFKAALLLPLVVVLPPRAGAGGSGGAAVARSGVARRQRSTASDETAGHLLARALGKLVLVATLFKAFPRARDVAAQRAVVFALAVYLMASLIMDVTASVVVGVLRLRVATHFNLPLVATSLSDFWGARWSLTASTLLYDTVYAPIVDVLRRRTGAAKPTATARCVGLLAAFTTSAAMHELLMWFATREVSWQWFTFFCVHGVALVLEVAARRAMPALSSRIPPVVGWLLTAVFVMTTAELWFYPPVLDAGIDERLSLQLRAVPLPVIDSLLQTSTQ